jgi:hypothetical protein
MVNKVEHYFYTVLGSKLMIKIFTLLREGNGFENCRKCKTKKKKKKLNFICLPEHPKTMQGAK